MKEEQNKENDVYTIFVQDYKAADTTKGYLGHGRRGYYARNGATMLFQKRADAQKTAEHLVEKNRFATAEVEPAKEHEFECNIVVSDCEGDVGQVYKKFNDAVTEACKV